MVFFVNYLHAYIGFHVDRVLMGGWTPLMHACDYGHDDIVKILLREGSNPNTQIGEVINLT